MQIGRRRLIERNCSKSELIGPDLERRPNFLPTGRAKRKRGGGVSVERNPAGNARPSLRNFRKNYLEHVVARWRKVGVEISGTRLEGRESVPEIASGYPADGTASGDRYRRLDVVSSLVEYSIGAGTRHREWRSRHSARDALRIDARFCINGINRWRTTRLFANSSLVDACIER